jgi:hypothetical protein
MLHADFLDDVFFQLDYVSTIVGEPAAIENVVHSTQELLPVADVWTPDVQWLLKSLRAAKTREIVDRFLRRAEAGLNS